jgi:hypothetical protein
MSNKAKSCVLSASIIDCASRPPSSSHRPDRGLRLQEPVACSVLPQSRKAVWSSLACPKGTLPHAERDVAEKADNAADQPCTGGQQHAAPSQRLGNQGQYRSGQTNRQQGRGRNLSNSTQTQTADRLSLDQCRLVMASDEGPARRSYRRARTFYARKRLSELLASKDIYSMSLTGLEINLDPKQRR